MTITATHVGDAVVLHVAGRLDAITSPEFEKTCLQNITSESRRMVLDFAGVEYISSAGLRAILLAGKKIHAGGGVMGFSGLRDTVKSTMEMAGFCTLFPVYDSTEAALEPR
jgi:anti-anti-sigma factor